MNRAHCTGILLTKYSSNFYNCVTQVMNMYGDLVMDAAPEKVCTHIHV